MTSNEGEIGGGCSITTSLHPSILGPSVQSTPNPDPGTGGVIERDTAR
jgi:hypothetical protein